MAQQIKSAAVLGAGVMGTGIAAHLAGMGVKTLLLDIVPRGLSDKEKRNPAVRNQLITKSLKAAGKARPPVFHRADDAQLIEVGNFTDDLPRIKECDWIVEVVIENLEIKRKLFAQIDEHRRPGSLITSNTSGLSISELLAGRSDDFVSNFFVSHFFNPVRFMRLLELVPGEKTDPDVFNQFAQFGFETLGKGIVYGKDTPNFVANRIGVYGLMYTLHALRRDGLSIEEVDTVFGPAAGRPRSAVFRTADLVGIDVLVHVANNCYENLPDDECRDTFKIPAYVEELVERGWLGQKTKGGFYKKVGKEICALNLDNFEYQPKQKVRADCIGATKGIKDVGARVKALLKGEDRLAKFAWDVTAHTLVYAAQRLGEICDDVVNCDRGMRWGFSWDLGPFETWDALGVAETVDRMTKDGLDVPSWVTDMLDSGQSTFYGGTAAKPTYYDVTVQKTKEIALDPRNITVAVLKETEKVVEKNAGATAYDIGDGVLLLEFHTKMNSVDDDVGKMLVRATDLAVEQGWNGVVIGNDHPNAFSAGANLFALIVAINQKAWDQVDQMIDGFQRANQHMRFANVPVVAAPAGLALGGGAEVVMSTDAVRSHMDLFIGLVEVGVGLIPAAGGCLRMLDRYCSQLPDDPAIDPMPFIQEIFKLVAMGTVCTGAHDAKLKGFLRPHDAITANRDLLIHDAKQTVLGMARAGYRPPRPLTLRLPGPGGATNLKWFVDNLRRGEQVSDHDFKIASKLAWVLCGGETSVRVKVDEQYILDLEREVFLSLCGEKKTQERIQHMLTAKKPLRN